MHDRIMGMRLSIEFKQKIIQDVTSRECDQVVLKNKIVWYYFFKLYQYDMF